MKRAGKSLLEVVIVISLLGLVLGTSATTLVGALRTSRQVRRDLDQAATLARLTALWRADAHAATSATLDPGCELTLPRERVVRYAAEKERLSRTVIAGGKVVHHERFAFAPGAKIAWELPAEFAGRLVRLEILADERPARAYLNPVRTARLEAAIGVAKPAEGSP
ncbi:MAG: hypothetical protein SFU86_02940 [Pirellulaceae bacterium]|nr:hypothetical protein [Pirellulaceae bacterium]